MPLSAAVQTFPLVTINIEHPKRGDAFEVEFELHEYNSESLRDIEGLDFGGLIKGNGIKRALAADELLVNAAESKLTLTFSRATQLGFIQGLYSYEIWQVSRRNNIIDGLIHFKK